MRMTFINGPSLNFSRNWIVLEEKWQNLSQRKCNKKGVLVSISPIFYEQLFCMKVFCTAFMCLQFGFVIFWWKDFGIKAAHKMLVKLTLCCWSLMSKVLKDKSILWNCLIAVAASMWLVVGSKCCHENYRCTCKWRKRGCYLHRLSRLSICIFLLHIYVNCWSL